MIPLRDANPSGTFPVVTVILIAINTLVWFYEVSLGERVNQLIVDYGLTPFRVVHSYRLDGGLMGNAVVPLFTSMFLHGGWMHVIGNMWFLWIFGDNVEDRLGHLKYLIFYLLCGVGAGVLHMVFNRGEQVPMVGASGAISGVLGAYLLSFPHARVYTLIIIFVIIRFIEIPAYMFLIFWFVFQFISGAAELGSHQQAGGVAYWAHMGGFGIGMLLLWLMPKRERRVGRESD